MAGRRYARRARAARRGRLASALRDRPRHRPERDGGRLAGAAGLWPRPGPSRVPPTSLAASQACPRRMRGARVRVQENLRRGVSHIRRIRLQTIEYSQENCPWYGEPVSGRRFYPYAGNHPLNATDSSRSFGFIGSVGGQAEAGAGVFGRGHRHGRRADPRRQPQATRFETEADRQHRIVWEAAMIAKVDASIAAGYDATSAEVDAWIGQDRGTI